MKTLGMLDADAARLEKQSIFDTSTLLAKAEAARAEREAQARPCAAESQSRGRVRDVSVRS